MSKKKGILRVYKGQKTNNETTIVGDELGLYRLWETVAEAMVSRKGQGKMAVDRGKVVVLRVESKSHFFKQFGNKN